jgi:hypothetical protein
VADDPIPTPPGSSPLRPDHWDVDVVLTSGRVARVRAIRPDDADRLRDLHSRLSPESRLLRFFTPMPTLPDNMVQRFVNVDHSDRVALVLELDEQLIAVGRYDRLSERPDEAEVAFVVDDRFQGRESGPSCWNTSPRSGSTRGSNASSPRRWPTTRACCASSAAPGSRWRAT